MLCRKVLEWLVATPVEGRASAYLVHIGMMSMLKDTKLSIAWGTMGTSARYDIRQVYCSFETSA